MIDKTYGLRAWMQQYAVSLADKSEHLHAFLDRRIVLLGAIWIAVTSALAAWRLATPAAPIHNLSDAYLELLGYTLVILAPILGYLVARAAVRSPGLTAPTRFRFAIWGRWRTLAPHDARALPVYGAIGFMASMLIGLLLNVVIRTLEFFTAVPAMGAHAPLWGRTLFSLMAADVVITGFFYMVVFVMALRTVPLFPRMLGFVWLLDITMQMFIARQIGLMREVPADVVVPLANLLEGNITKVLISMLVWLPYLILSERVNVTYRHRTRTPAPADIAGD